MTKPIIVVKVPCKLLYVIQVKEFLIKCSTSWPYLISEFLVAYITIVASDWPRTFLHPRCFCLAFHDMLHLLSHTHQYIDSKHHIKKLKSRTCLISYLGFINSLEGN